MSVEQVRVEDGVLKVFREVSTRSELTDDVILRAQYLDDGLLDSIEIVDWVLGLEDAFDVVLEPSELESTEFRTMEGVVRLIVAKLAEEGRRGKSAVHQGVDGPSVSENLANAVDDRGTRDFDTTRHL